MRTNQAGIDLIKEFEGFRSKAYYCGSGVLTIGYGHTNFAGKPRIKPGDTVTRAEAEEILRRDLVKYENAVKKALGSAVEQLNENQFSACVSLCYNVGARPFAIWSLGDYIREGRIIEAADRFLQYTGSSNPANRKGLLRRRKAERALYLR